MTQDEKFIVNMFERQELKKHRGEEGADDELLYDVITINFISGVVESKSVWLGIKGRARAERLRVREQKKYYCNDEISGSVLMFAGRASIGQIIKSEDLI